MPDRPLSDQLADALDGRAASRARTGSNDHQQGDGVEVNELSQLAGALRRLPDLEPDPEFAAIARFRLMNRIRTKAPTAVAVTSPAPARSISHRLFDLLWRTAMRKWATTLAVLALLGSGTAAYASGGAVPGEALYPVKRLIENVQVSMAPDHGAMSRTLVTARVAEADTLSGRALHNVGDPEALLAGLKAVRAELTTLRQTLTGDDLARIERIMTQIDEAIARLEAQLAGQPTRPVTPGPGETRTPRPPRPTASPPASGVITATLTALAPTREARATERFVTKTAVAPTRAAWPTSVSATRTALAPTREARITAHAATRTAIAPTRDARRTARAATQTAAPPRPTHGPGDHHHPPRHHPERTPAPPTVVAGPTQGAATLTQPAPATQGTPIYKTRTPGPTSSPAATTTPVPTTQVSATPLPATQTQVPTQVPNATATPARTQPPASTPTPAPTQTSAPTQPATPTPGVGYP